MSDEVARCSFCGFWRHARDVVVGPRVSICRGCNGLTADIFAARDEGSPEPTATTVNGDVKPTGNELRRSMNGIIDEMIAHPRAAPPK